MNDKPAVNYMEVVETEEAIDKSRSRSKLVKPQGMRYGKWLELRLAAKRVEKAMKGKQ